MVSHNKLTVTAEYCRARRIPYRIKCESLYIDRRLVCYSLYNLTYADILRTIDNFVVYDVATTDFVRVAD